MTELPQLWGVLYAEPNHNGERKTCGNCKLAVNSAAGMMAGTPVSRCTILPSRISPEMVCGYHVPQEGADPELAGLETTPGGTSCDKCRFYQPGTDQEGTCEAVEGEDGGPAHVQAMGCCARWEGESGDGAGDDY
jgi:hypothetical protein